MKLFNNYNKCIGKQVFYEHNFENKETARHKRSLVKIGLYAGINFTKLNFTGGDPETSTDQNPESILYNTEGSCGNYC